MDLLKLLIDTTEHQDIQTQIDGLIAKHNLLVQQDTAAISDLQLQVMALCVVIVIVCAMFVWSSWLLGRRISYLEKAVKESTLSKEPGTLDARIKTA